MVNNEEKEISPNNSDPIWQMFASFWLVNEPGNPRLAADKVVAIVHQLNWAAANLAQIEQTVYRAAQSALDRGSIGSRLLVRLFMRLEGDAAAGIPPAPKAGRGWGFFLVQREEASSSPLANAKDTMIELFLYQE
jgi:hypothetical protein